jgi:hypothetical protein
LLKKRIAEGGAQCWLVNTGWSGGKATDPGIKRMPIKATRALLNAALDGSLNDADFRKDPNFGFDVPVAVPGVDSNLLDPRAAWADKDEYDRTAHKLVQLFVDNFAQFEAHVDQGVKDAAPQAAELLRAREVDHEAGAAFGAILQFDAATGLARRARDLSQAETGALAVALGRIERVEDALAQSMRNARSGIARGQRNRVPVARDVDEESTVAVHRVAGIDRQVEQRQLELVGVGVGMAGVLGDTPAELDAIAERARDQVVAALEALLRSSLLTSAPSPRTKLNNWFVRRLPRATALLIPLASSTVRGSLVPRTIIRAPASIAARMLRESWTMVPVKRLIASAFCIATSRAS